MSEHADSLGRIIATARKNLRLSQKDLAALIQIEDELGNKKQMSPQYLNDIEHDRRSPSSQALVAQFSEKLGLDQDYLMFLAGRWPDAIRNAIRSEKDFGEAMVAFRRKVSP